jgi:hypothetical protein
MVIIILLYEKKKLITDFQINDLGSINMTNSLLET